MSNATTLALFAIATVTTACSASNASDVGEGSADIRRAPKVCTDANKAEVLAHALAAPITPPRLAAGIDAAGGNNWAGITRADVESDLCAGTYLPANDGDDGSKDYAWGGDSQPIVATFDAGTNTLSTIQLNAGYTGAVTFKSRDGAHTYVAKVGAPVTRDGAPVTIDFGQDVFPAGSELIDALYATFAPDLPALKGGCHASPHRCLLRQVPDGEKMSGIVGARDLHFYMVFPGAGDRAATSTAEYFYMFPQKPQLTQ